MSHQEAIEWLAKYEDDVHRYWAAYDARDDRDPTTFPNAVLSDMMIGLLRRRKLLVAFLETQP